MEFATKKKVKIKKNFKKMKGTYVLVWTSSPRRKVNNRYCSIYISGYDPIFRSSQRKLFSKVGLVPRNINRVMLTSILSFIFL